MVNKKDAKILKRCFYVVQNGIISFPQGGCFSINKLEKVLKDAKKLKQKDNEIMCGIILDCLNWR